MRRGARGSAERTRRHPGVIGRRGRRLDRRGGAPAAHNRRLARADNPIMSLPEPLGPQPYVDKLLVAACVMLPGPEPVEGAFALSPASRLRDGPESLLELLNGEARVVPFIRAADEVVLLLARDAIDWVDVGPRVDRSRVRPVTFMITREEHVQVRLLDGRKVEGRLAMELPEHLNRVSDFLNQPEDFFALTARAGTMLINKSRVAWVRLFEDSPPPPGEPAD